NRDRNGWNWSEKAERNGPDAQKDATNTGIEVEKDDPKELDWYSRKAEKDNSDGWLIQDNSKEPAYAKEEAPNIGIEVEKDNSNKQTSDRSCHEKESGAEKNVLISLQKPADLKIEDPAGLNNEPIKMDHQRPADIELAVEESEPDFYQKLEDTEDEKEIIND
ncbi:3100_t:CDS:2, partial [Cetraspora pellucida]